MWTDLELCSSEDVTVSKMYCTSGIFRVKSTAEVVAYPEVKASVRMGRMVIGIDKNVILMDNDNEGSCQLLNYDSNIDCIATVNGGQVVVCGLSDGHVHGSLINGIPIFDLAISEEDLRNSSSKTFVGIREMNQHYYLMTSNGSLYLLDDLDDDLNLQNGTVCEQTLTDRTIVYDKTLLSPVNLRSVFKPLIGKLSILAFTIFGSGRDQVAIYCDCQFIYQHSINEGTSADQIIKTKFPKSFDVIKMIVNLENYILLLTVNGGLYEYCPETHLVIRNRTNRFHLEDILVLENDLNSAIELMILDRPHGGSKKAMKIVNFPEMTQKYELLMSEHCWLVSQPKSSLNMYYMEGLSDADLITSTKLPEEIELKQITELHPMQRFKKLISRGLFDEAEEFAKQMNLSLNLIHEYRAQNFVIKLANERNLEALRTTFKEFMALLREIESVQFLVNLRHTDVPDRALKETFLNFLSEKLANKPASVRIENELEVAGDIEEQLRRLDTLKIIDPYECNSNWQHFTNELNLFKKCLEMLKTNVQNASMTWSRHSSAIIPFIESEHNLTMILAAIPKDTELLEILHWLRHITPGLIQAHPQFMSMAVTWCSNKAKRLESTSMWPVNALQFMKNVHSILTSTDFIVTDLKRMYKSNLETINHLLNALQELADLKSEFNLTIKLENFSDEDLEKTALNLLQRVQINHLRKLLTSFIVPLFLKHNQSAAGAMAQYIQFLVANRKFTSQWQEKSVIVIEMLTNEDERLQAALLVLNEAPVPWIDALKPLISYSKSSHPLAAEIVTKHQLQVVKMIRTKYNYPANADGDNMQLVYRIVKMGSENMVAEIRSIIKVMPNLATRIYLYCIPHFIRQQKLEVALAFFDDFNGSGEVKLLFELFVTAFEGASEIYMQSVIHFLNIVSSRSIGKEMRMTVDDLITVYKLRSGFGITLEVVTGLVCDKETLLDEGIEYILEEVRMNLNNEDILGMAFNNLATLCKLLKVNCVAGVIRICQIVDCGAFTFGIANLLRESVEIDNSNSEEYIELAVYILAQDIDNLSSKAHDLPTFPMVYEILANCASFAKIDVIELHQILPLVRVGKNMYKCVDCHQYFMKNKKVLSEMLVKFFSSANKEASRRESTRKSRRESYSMFDETIQTIATDTPTTIATNYQSTNVDYVINCLAVIFEIVVLQENNAISQIFRKYFNEDFEEMEIDLLTKGFSQAANQLYQNQMLMEMHLIFHEVVKFQRRVGLSIVSSQSVVAVNRKLLRSLLSKEDTDIQECFLILTKTASSELLSALESEMRSVVEKRNFSALAELYFFSKNRLEEAAKYKSQRVKYKYFADISRWNPTMKLNLETFNATALPYLKIDIKTLEKMCHEFNCDFQNVITAQILQILSSNDLQFQVQQDDMGVERIKILTSVEAILNQCVPLVNAITVERIPSFTKRLIKFAETVDSYFYEMFLVIIEILTITDSLPPQMSTWKDILLFLQHKMVVRRRVRPSQLEMEWWLKTQNEMASVLPKISKYRFPFFRLIQSLIDTLGDEINVENCVSWFPLISTYALLQNIESTEDIGHEIEVFCSKAVKNSISEWKMQNEDNRNDVWHLVPENDDFLQAILRLVQNMKSEFKVFSILYYTMNQMPEGADQVEAAFECYSYALEHEAILIDNDKSKDAMAKIKRKYPMVKTQHLLHVYQMTDDSLMELIEKPMDLIASLYLHPVIMQQTRPDIKGLVTAIAEVHNVPLHPIQVLLLKKLLRLDDGSKELSDEESVVILESDYVEVNEHLLRNVDKLTRLEITSRVNYILSNWSDTASISFLVFSMHSLLKTGGTSNHSMLQKSILLYECLSMNLMTNESKLMCEDIMKQEEFVTYKILYLLHKVNFQLDKAPMSAETLKVANKIDILKQMWQSYAKTKEGIEAMLLICLQFNITVKNIWDGILRKMVSLKMIDELRSVMDLLRTRKELALLGNLPMAIQFVLTEPLKCLTKEKTNEQELKLCETLLLLQTCPLTGKLDLLELAQLLLNLDRPYMAAVVLPYMSKTAERQPLLDLLEPFKNEKLKRDIDELSEFGIMSMITKSAINILFRKPEQDED